MIGLVPPSEVEQLVGQERWHFTHIGHYEGGTLTILHSHRCKNDNPDLRDCVFSEALGNRWDVDLWESARRMPVILDVRGGRLVPSQRLRRTYIPRRAS